MAIEGRESCWEGLTNGFGTGLSRSGLYEDLFKVDGVFEVLGL
jgi:hypothetical protein